MRLQALWLVCTGPSFHDGAAAIGGHPQTVQDWVAWHWNEWCADALCHRTDGVMPADCATRRLLR